jgi:hypothetical protein
MSCGKQLEAEDLRRCETSHDREQVVVLLLKKVPTARHCRPAREQVVDVIVSPLKKLPISTTAVGEEVGAHCRRCW